MFRLQSRLRFCSEMLKYFVLSLVSLFIFGLVFKPTEKCENSSPKFWLYRENGKYGILESVERILYKLGWERTHVNASEIDYDDWDLLWSWEHMSIIPLNYSLLKPYQRINHFPGNIYLVSKSSMATFINSKYVPKAFNDVESLQRYTEQNPTVRFVQKLKANRGVSLKTINEMNFTSTGKLSTTYFAQAYVEDPLLISGHKFDLNIYVVITSVNPLRVYYYNKNIHFRFCKQPYDPENFTNVDTYVISDSHISGPDFPAIKKYFSHSYTYKQAFEAIMRGEGHDPNVIYQQIEDCIRTVVMKVEPMINEHIFTLQAKPWNFFELVRFDFVVDAKLNLHLMEVNMSPNLLAWQKHQHNRHMMEGVIYNTLNLVGVGSYLRKKHIREFEKDENDFVWHDNSLTVSPEVCLEKPCSESCGEKICELCWKCLSWDMKETLRDAYMEHVNIGDMKRVVPPSNVMRNCEKT